MSRPHYNRGESSRQAAQRDIIVISSDSENDNETSGRHGRGNIANPGGMVLKGHQKKVVEFMGDPGAPKGIIVYHGVGSGKSITAIATAQALIVGRKVTGATFLVPSQVVEQWKSEMERALATGLLTQSSFARIQIQSHTKWYRRGDAAITDASGKLIVVDEAHYYRTPISPQNGGVRNGKKSDFLLRACQTAKRLLFLTATPVVNRVSDIRNLLVALDGQTRYNAYGYESGITHLMYAPTHKQVFELLRCKVSYAPHEDIRNLELPHVSVEEVRLKMPLKYLERYHAVETDAIRSMPAVNDASANSGDEASVEIAETDQGPDFDSASGRPLTALNARERDAAYTNGVIQHLRRSKDLRPFLCGVRQVVNTSGDTIPSPKLDWVRDRIKEWILVPMRTSRAHKRVLIYTQWRILGMDPVVQLLKKMKVDFRTIHGDLDARQRAESVKAFNSRKANVLVVTNAGKEGIDLKDVDRVIILEHPWKPSDIDQVVGRATRMGQRAPNRDTIRVYILLLRKPTPGEFDQDVQDAMRDSPANLESLQILRGKKESLLLLPSADDTLREAVQEKQMMRDDFNWITRKASIEKQTNCF